MRSCIIFSCETDGASKVGLFKMPMNVHDRIGWLNFVTKANGMPLKNPSGHFYVCRKHFRKCCLPKITYFHASLNKGHYPSVVDGHVIVNEKSKCIPVTPEEDLKLYHGPDHSNENEKRRALLVKKLTSFGTQKKIVVGERKVKSTGSPEELSSDSSQTCRSVHPIENEIEEIAISPCKKRKVSEKHSQDNAIPLKKDVLPPAANPPLLPSTNSDVSLQYARPSLETKTRLLLRENTNLRRSVRDLEKKVDELERKVEELIKFRAVMEPFAQILQNQRK